MTRLVAFIVGVLVAIFGWMHSPVAFAVPSGVQTFGYHTSGHSMLAANAVTERGPPATDSDSPSALARPSGPTTRPGNDYDGTAPLVSVDSVAGFAGEAVKASDGLSPRRPSGVAAKSADEFVDLASAQRRTHILDGDATGGGHLWPGLPGKTPFPKDWSAGRVMHEISDVATDPAAWANVTNQGQRAVVYGTRGVVDIKVVVNRGTGDIITGHPTNLPRNSR